ncbi:MAG: periplasmic heavy metal sensor [Deltaproteobacteria bacterium]|nr:periplasmic heavy metal sensor [Deltaproteobacteria bacterium]
MKRIMTILAGLALVAGVTAALAWEGGPAPGPGILAALVEMQVTAPQKRELAGILASHQEELFADLDQLAAARGRLGRVLIADQPSAEEARAAVADLSLAGEQLTGLLCTLLPQLRAVLTPAQREILVRHRDQLLDGLAARGQKRRQLLQSWIAQNQP